MKHFEFSETAIEYLPKFSKETGVEVFVKRDDTFPLAGGGNKARKLQYILYQAKMEGADAIVTAGDINSNHCRATAVMASSLAMKVKLVIHNSHPENEKYSKNMAVSRLCGAEIIYCEKSDVKDVMDRAMDDFASHGYKPFYIYGGGHLLSGSYAYYDVVKNMKNGVGYNYVYLASGTGTTQAGLYVGFKRFFPKTKVCGISIARDAARGAMEIYKSVIELENYLSLSTHSEITDINFSDKFLADGYETASSEILSLIRKMATSEGLLLDPTYTGKAFLGLNSHIKSGEIKENERVLFWHTGGLLNLLSMH